MTNATHLTEEEWARQEVGRLTAELEVERSARGALGDRLAALEKEMKRDQCERQRNLRVGAALTKSSASSTALLAKESASDREEEEEAEEEEDEAGDDAAPASPSAESGTKKKKKKKKKKEKVNADDNDEGETAELAGGASTLPAKSAVTKYLDGIFPYAGGASTLPAKSAVTKHLDGIFPYAK